MSQREPLQARKLARRVVSLAARVSGVLSAVGGDARGDLVPTLWGFGAGNGEVGVMVRPGGGDGGDGMVDGCPGLETGL